MTDYRDREPSGPPAGRVVLLPGRGYSPAMPLLAVVSDTLVENGWAVREVWWQVPEGLTGRRAARWVADQARTAADGWSDRPLLVGKSLGALASPYAASSGLDGVWLTPVLVDRRVVKGIRRNKGRQLLIGGTADDAWVSDLAARLPGDVLELPGADHGLVVKGDKAATAAVRDRVRATLTDWLD